MHIYKPYMVYSRRADLAYILSQEAMFCYEVLSKEKGRKCWCGWMSKRQEVHWKEQETLDQLNMYNRQRTLCWLACYSEDFVWAICVCEKYQTTVTSCTTFIWRPITFRPITCSYEAVVKKPILEPKDSVAMLMKIVIAHMAMLVLRVLFI